MIHVPYTKIISLLAILSSMARAHAFDDQGSDLSDDDNHLLLRQERLTIDHTHQPNIDGVLQLVETHIKTGIQPSQIAVIFDVDGTLTNRSMPSALPAKDRDGSTHIVLKLMEMGVNITISSAWNNFNETLKRLDEVGFKKTYKINHQDEIEEGYYQSKKFYSLGLVASVQDHLVDRTYFRQKALAPYVVYPKETIDEIQKVIFADDSPANIQYFKRDVESNYLYPKTNQFDYFFLTPIKGGLTKKKIRIPPTQEKPKTEKEKPKYSCWDYLWSKINGYYSLFR